MSFQLKYTDSILLKHHFSMILQHFYLTFMTLYLIFYNIPLYLLLAKIDCFKKSLLRVKEIMYVYVCEMCRVGVGRVWGGFRVCVGSVMG